MSLRIDLAPHLNPPPQGGGLVGTISPKGEGTRGVGSSLKNPPLSTPLLAHVLHHAAHTSPLTRLHDIEIAPRIHPNPVT
jgi:hypothetical protein